MHMRRPQDVKSKLDAYRENKIKQGPNSAEEAIKGNECEKVPVISDSRETFKASTPTYPNVENERPVSLWYLTALKALLWLLLWGFFIEIQFGAVFFVVSSLFLLYWSLRGSRRKPGVPSAYSVFNKNCEAIEGTLTAEQFERELRYGPTSVTR